MRERRYFTTQENVSCNKSRHRTHAIASRGLRLKGVLPVVLWLVESCALQRSSNYIPRGRPKWQVRTKETATPVVAQWQSQSAESRDAAQSTLDAAWLLALRGATLRSDIVRATIASGRFTCS